MMRTLPFSAVVNMFAAPLCIQAPTAVERICNWNARLASRRALTEAYLEAYGQWSRQRESAVDGTPAYYAAALAGAHFLALAAIGASAFAENRRPALLADHARAWYGTVIDRAPADIAARAREDLASAGRLLSRAGI